MNLVVVESPAKAKTINKYLGKDYIVLASYGHIRDLPSKNGSVDPEKNFEMQWELDAFSKKYLKEITDAAKKESQEIINDLIIAAYNNAKENLKKKSADELSKITGGLNLPLDFK